MAFEVIIEFISLIIGLIAIIYIFGNIKLVDRGFDKIWKWIFLAFILFILGKVIRILDLIDIIDASSYKSVSGLLFIVVLAIGIIKFNKEIR